MSIGRARFTARTSAEGDVNVVNMSDNGTADHRDDAKSTRTVYAGDATATMLMIEEGTDREHRPVWQNRGVFLHHALEGR